MNTGFTPFSPRRNCVPPGSAVDPIYQFLGDYWTFAVAYENANETPIDLAGLSLTPSAELLVGWGGAPVSLAIISTDVNVVVFGIDSTTLPSIAAQNPNSKAFPVRLRALATDDQGHTRTYVLRAVVPLSPQSVDLSTLPEPSTTVALMGPTGPKGDTGGTLSQAQMFVQSLIFG